MSLILLLKEEEYTNMKIMEETLKRGGCTYDVRVKQFYRGNGYIVSMGLYEYRVSLDAFNDEVIASYIACHWHDLCRENRYLGTWIDKNTVYLDISLEFETKSKAIWYAIKNDQKSIYNIKEGVIEI